MFVSKVVLLLVLAIIDGEIRGAPVEHRLEDILIFDSDPDQPPGTEAAPDPTKRVKVPSISQDEAEVIVYFFGTEINLLIRVRSTSRHC